MNTTTTTTPVPAAAAVAPEAIPKTRFDARPLALLVALALLGLLTFLCAPVLAHHPDSVEVKDAQGRVVTVRKDDLRGNLNFVGVLKENATVPVAGNQITYAGVQYIIDDVSNDGTNESFRRVGLNVTKYQEIA